MVLGTTEPSVSVITHLNLNLVASVITDLNLNHVASVITHLNLNHIASVITHLNLNHIATTGRQEVTIAAIFFRQYTVYNLPDDRISPLELELSVQCTLYRPWI
jgi:hypothetical protein